MQEALSWRQQQHHKFDILGKDSAVKRLEILDETVAGARELARSTTSAYKGPDP
jgi:hypothetical protein